MADPGQAALITELQNIVQLLRNQVQELTRKSDQGTADIQQLRDDASQAAWRREGSDQGGRHHQPIRLLDPKSAKPEVFEGDRRKVRGWGKRVMAYANAIAPGFRKALKWAMIQKEAITETDVEMLEWQPSKEANSALFDILMSITDGEPQTMVENANGDENGF